MIDGPPWLAEATFGCVAGRVAGRFEIRLEGEVDLAARPVLLQAIEAALEFESPDVRLDLKAVTFADSSAVAWLLLADRRVSAADGRLTLVDCSPAVRQLLRLTGIDGRLVLVESGPML